MTSYYIWGVKYHYLVISKIIFLQPPEVIHKKILVRFSLDVLVAERLCEAHASVLTVFLAKTTHTERRMEQHQQTAPRHGMGKTKKNRMVERCKAYESVENLECQN